MNDMMERLEKIGIIPVVTVESREQGVRIMNALKNGGLMAAEVTFRTPAAADALQGMKEACPRALIGAGTILTTDQVDQALDAGAEFIVTPGISKKIVNYCREKRVPVIPGIMTPTELQKAVSLGLDHVKFFPAEAAGGLKTLKAISAPFPHVRFMPTGGISLENAKTYLDYDKVYCCGGSWITAGAKKGDYEQVALEAKKAVTLVEKNLY
ncbi:MAG: bifunctional 4-hydroxy-2-oxoglutarate aldolase/2-dehydro-3-deoxy-phosphogluconate aldolase [Eubacterium sp.]|nr:bifunctional 4-hydroxy-2-oxoglutarate aldolase/2-dehydro-3-deoxy-phosphogluconate aldolase [Eubacterium sp.]